MKKVMLYKHLAMLSLFFAFLLTLSFVSCGHSNTIYFDMEQQAVIRCKGIISNLYIKNKDNEDCFHFSVLPGKKGSNALNVKEINKSYFIKRTNCHINLPNFKLQPETEYEIINHSNGDAVDGKLLIKTDKNCFVIYADKISCQ